MLCTFCTNMAGAFAIAAVQETLKPQDFYKNADYSRILL